MWANELTWCLHHDWTLHSKGSINNKALFPSHSSFFFWNDLCFSISRGQPTWFLAACKECGSSAEMLVSGMQVNLPGNPSLSSQWWPPTDPHPCPGNGWWHHASHFLVHCHPQPSRALEHTLAVKRIKAPQSLGLRSAEPRHICYKVRTFVNQGQVHTAR